MIPTTVINISYYIIPRQGLGSTYKMLRGW
jgi:hypothetical protein